MFHCLFSIFNSYWILFLLPHRHLPSPFFSLSFLTLWRLNDFYIFSLISSHFSILDIFSLLFHAVRFLTVVDYLPFPFFIFSRSLLIISLYFLSSSPSSLNLLLSFSYFFFSFLYLWFFLLSSITFFTHIVFFSLSIFLPYSSRIFLFFSFTSSAFEPRLFSSYLTFILSPQFSHIYNAFSLFSLSLYFSLLSF